MVGFTFFAPLFHAGNLGWTLFVGAVLLLGLTVAVLARLRWTQSRPLATCVVLSVIAHLLLISAVYLSRTFDSVPPPGDPGIAVVLSAPVPEAAVSPAAAPPDSAVLDQPSPDPPDSVMPWDRLAVEPAPQPKLTPVPALSPVTAPKKTSVADPQSDRNGKPSLEPASDRVQTPEKKQNAPPIHPLPLPGGTAPVDVPDDALARAPDAEPSRRPVPEPLPLAPLPPARPLGPIASRSTEPMQEVRGVDSGGESEPVLPDLAAGVPETAWHPIEANANANANAKAESMVDVALPVEPVRQVPARYQARMAENRQQLVTQRGGNAETEAAVRAALNWLARNQNRDGHWDASQHGAGQGQLVEGRSRGGAGIQSDTGITGLALLALLGAGHTHEQGAYREHVRRGLLYLVREQTADGCLAGNATRFARMYCHGIASLALCEALAMTGDERLRPYAQRAVHYTLRSQHRVTGGWRYHPGDHGDTSQFGWQVMVLASAEQSGMEVPVESRQGMQRFLASVTSGTSRGLASYQPGGPPTVSMTAEVLACRAFLHQVDDRVTEEAAQFIGNRGVGADATGGDLYFWYYATIGLHLSKASSWPRWNASLTRHLIASQQQTPQRDAGSWAPVTKWAGHGGRVYSTALSAMCLEVYYRYQN